MSIVENLISQIAESKLSGVSKPLGLNLDDDTFAKLLDKQLNVNTQENLTSFENLGMPSGFEIEPFDAEKSEQINNITEVDLSDFKIQDVNVGKQELSVFFHKSDDNSPFSKFIINQAANAYNVFEKEFIADMNDFAQDLAKMI